MNEEQVVQQIVSTLMDIEDNLRRIAEAMEQANERPTVERDEYGDRI